MSLLPLLYLNVVADRTLNPGAIALHFGEGDLNALLPLVATESFAAIAASIPCLVAADVAQCLPPELLGALQDAGCLTVSGDACYCSDGQTKPVLPPATQWLSGNWYLAPPVRSTGNQSASRALSLKLLQRVAADADTFEIEAIFRQDPVLAYHLLRLVNSLGVGIGKHISSFSQAILILGRQQLKRWLNLMLFAANRDDYRSSMLLAHVAVRARRMELLAKASGLDRSAQEHAFMAGMFSLLGTLFGMPLADVLNPLKLNATLAAAVLQHEGEIGHLLQADDYAERAEENRLTDLLGRMSLPTADYNRINLESHQWMLGVIHDKQDSVDA